MRNRSGLLSSVIMTRGEPISIPAPLPEGYSFRFYTPSMEDEWCRIQCSAQHFADKGAAATAFREEFSAQPALLRRRMIFVCDNAGRPVGTAVLWPGNDLDKPLERIHWVALIPGLQGRGIGKALIAKLLDVYRTEDSSDGIYLIVRSNNYRTIHICQQFGFEAYPGPYPQHLHSQEGAGDAHATWQIIDQKLAEYKGITHREDQNFPAAPATPAMFFERANMFGKCSICKVFEITAPAQSGDVLHYHDYCQIWYVTRGHCEHYVEGQKYIMSVGDAFLLPHKVMHRTLLQNDSSIICCEFYMESLFPSQASSYNKLQEITQNISFTMLFQQELYSAQPKFTLSHQGQREVEKLMSSMVMEYNNEAPFYEDRLYLQILELLITFAREFTMSPVREVSEKVFDKYRSMVEAAILYIDQHYDEPISLEDICKISMVSKTYFCYLFKLLTQKTFVEYLTDLRINRAMELLRQTNLPVIDISQTVGFQDSTHFSRTFKQRKGISPREYRRAAKHQ